MAIIEITMENFDEKVLKSDKPVVLDFWASWCGPCKMQAPIFDACAKEAGDSAVFGKVNVDEQMQLAGQFEVMSIPTIIVIKNGNVIFRAAGVQSEHQIMAALK